MANSSKGRRSDCPISYSLDLFGDRWTLLVLRDLLLAGKRHFQELLDSDEGIASNILADRLKRLEGGGVIERLYDPQDRRRFVYRPTPKGIELVPVLMELAFWGAKHDRQTGAPRTFVDDFRVDRDRLIAERIERLRDS